MITTSKQTKSTPKEQALKDMKDSGVNTSYLRQHNEILQFIEQGRQY